ncbi:MAG: porin family protein [Mucinivorans sp.]
MRHPIVIAIVVFYSINIAVSQGINAKISQGGAMRSDIPISWSFGAKIGANYADFAGSPFSTQGILGFVGGGYVEMGIGQRFGVSLDVLYSSQGSKFSKKNSTEYQKDVASYLIFPVLLTFQPVRNLRIKAGVQPSIMLNMQRFYESSRLDVLDQYNRFDLSIPVGISYCIRHIEIDLRYHIGVTNLLPNNGEKARNSVFTLSVGYRFFD